MILSFYTLRSDHFHHHRATLLLLVRVGLGQRLQRERTRVMHGHRSISALALHEEEALVGRRRHDHDVALDNVVLVLQIALLRAARVVRHAIRSVVEALVLHGFLHALLLEPVLFLLRIQVANVVVEREQRVVVHDHVERVVVAILHRRLLLGHQLRGRLDVDGAGEQSEEILAIAERRSLDEQILIEIEQLEGMNARKKGRTITSALWTLARERTMLVMY